MRTFACLAAPCCLLVACAAPAIPVVPPALGCPVPPSLAQACSAPRTLAIGTSYAELLIDYRADRASLAACARSQRDLVRLLASCQADLADYNASLGDRAQTRP